MSPVRAKWRAGGKERAPGTWSTWALTPAGLQPLWSVPIGPVSLPNGFGSSFTVAPAGPVLFITRLDVPGIGSCGSVSYVDTGTPAAPAAVK